jgi:DnaA-homolog protein
VRQLPLGVRLSDRARFESFAPGANAEALAALRTLLQPAAGGVVWLWGPQGSGRSHLLQAACAAVAPAGYFPLTELSALGPGVLEGAGALACVAVDDVQTVAGDADWERALFFLHREVERQGGRLILAGTSAPAQAGFGLADLASRLGAAQVHALQALDDAGQREALRLRAALRGLDLPEETASYLQRRHPRDMPSLMALLERLDLEALAAQRRLTVPFIRQALTKAEPSVVAPGSPPDDPAAARE